MMSSLQSFEEVSDPSEYRSGCLGYTEKPFADLAKGLEELGNEMGLTIRCQHEDIFNKMHRI